MSTPKFKVGDLVVVVRGLTYSNRDIGEVYTVYRISNEVYHSGQVYFEEGKTGEYEVNLRLATKLEKALK